MDILSFNRVPAVARTLLTCCNRDENKTNKPNNYSFDGGNALSTAAEAAAAAATATAEVEARRQSDATAMEARRGNLGGGRRGSAEFGDSAAAPEVLVSKR